MINTTLPTFYFVPKALSSAPALRLQQKTFDMMLAVPQIMATRIWNMATVPMHTDTQQKEMHTMIAEKESAFVQSMADINSQIFASQLALGKQWMVDWQRLLGGDQNAFNDFGDHIDQETIKIIDKGISPYAKTVEANKKRLIR